MPILYSIVIPTYNRANLIANTINSVLRQEYNNFELIVVDDGSTDNTTEVVNPFLNNNPTNKISYYKKENGERAAARNYGLDRAKGDYIIFFDSDDELYPNHLTEATKYINANPGVEIMHFRYDIKNNDGKIISEGPVFNTDPTNKLITGNFLSCNGVVIKKEILKNYRFNEDRQLSAVEDWELWLRLSVKYRVHYINTITSTIFNHDNRSVLVTNKEKLIKRIELLIKYVTANNDIVEKYSANMYRFRASCYSYVSLHLALTKQHRKDTVVYLFKSLAINPAFIFEKRFFGILKNLI